jgi:heme oxygenase
MSTNDDIVDDATDAAVVAMGGHTYRLNMKINDETKLLKLAVWMGDMDVQCIHQYHYLFTPSHL